MRKSKPAKEASKVQTLPLEQQSWRLPCIPYDGPESQTGIGECGEHLVCMFRQHFWHDLPPYFAEIKARVTRTEGANERQVKNTEYLEAVKHLRDLGVAAATLLEQVRKTNPDEVAAILRQSPQIPIVASLQRREPSKHPELFLNGMSRGIFEEVLRENIKLLPQPKKQVGLARWSKKRAEQSASKELKQTGEEMRSEDEINKELGYAFGARVFDCLNGIRKAYQTTTPETSLGKRIAKLPESFSKAEWCEVAKDWLKYIVFVKFPETYAVFERQIRIHKAYLSAPSNKWHYVFRERIKPGFIKAGEASRKLSGNSPELL